eukprot:6214021-Pleurochrysis_carterae.AAC.1
MDSGYTDDLHASCACSSFPATTRGSLLKQPGGIIAAGQEWQRRAEAIARATTEAHACSTNRSGAQSERRHHNGRASQLPSIGSTSPRRARMSLQDFPRRSKVASRTEATPCAVNTSFLFNILDSRRTMMALYKTMRCSAESPPRSIPRLPSSKVFSFSNACALHGARVRRAHLRVRARRARALP